MNKRSVKKSVARPRAAKTSRNHVAHKSVARRKSVKAEAQQPIQVPAAAITQIAVPSATFRAHKFRVGETVLYTSSPITRPGASGAYKVVKLLPSDGDDYQYRIKNSGEAFERVAKESQLETEH
jgi:hypothetical protein